MNIILSINGGMGKSVMATAICRAIRNNYPTCKLYVITGYPDVFSNISSVDMTFAHGQEHYFYSKYVEGKEVKIFANEPYMVTEHILGQEHLIETWCKMNGVAYNGEMPEIDINEREFLYYNNKYTSNKEIMVIQTNGGGQCDVKYSWARDIPYSIGQSIINEFASRYTIYHIRKEEQLSFENTIPVHETYKGIATLIARSKKRLFIDSFCQHTAMALGLKSTVLWIANSPKVFGYELHDNILANQENKTPDLRHSLFTKYNIGGALIEFPYQNEKDIFNIDSIIASLINQ